MKEFFKRLKLIDYFTITLPISKTDFVKRLYEITLIQNSSIFNNFKYFTSSKIEFIGKVGLNGFKLKLRRRILDTETDIAVAYGILTESDGQLTIETKIKGFDGSLIVVYGFLLLINFIIVFGIFASWNKIGLIEIVIFPIIGTLIFVIPYFIMTGSVKLLKYKLKREFIKLSKTEINDNLK